MRLDMHKIQAGNNNYLISMKRRLLHIMLNVVDMQFQHLLYLQLIAYFFLQVRLKYLQLSMNLQARPDSCIHLLPNNRIDSNGMLHIYYMFVFVTFITVVSQQLLFATIEVLAKSTWRRICGSFGNPRLIYGSIVYV